ncbi:hypothetical protein Tco_1310247 [Tanacetum coccineum]
MEPMPQGSVGYLVMVDLRTCDHATSAQIEVFFHQVPEKMYQTVKKLYWWPQYESYIATYVKQVLDMCLSLGLNIKEQSGLLYNQRYLNEVGTISRGFVIKLLSHLKGMTPFGTLRLKMASPPVCWAEVEKFYSRARDSSRDDEKIIQVKQRMQADRVVRFGKRGKLNPRFVGPFKVIKRVGDVAYKLELPEELSRVHNTFHVSNLKKCHADEPLAVPLDGLHFDDKLQFVEEPIEITDREVEAKPYPVSQGSMELQERS